jgi:hypothetical protein
MEKTKERVQNELDRLRKVSKGQTSQCILVWGKLLDALEEMGKVSQQIRTKTSDLMAKMEQKERDFYELTRMR